MVLSGAQVFWFSCLLVQLVLWSFGIGVWYSSGTICLFIISSQRITFWTVVSVTSLSLHRTWPRFYHDQVRKYWQILSENIDRSCRKTLTESVWENICSPKLAPTQHRQLTNSFLITRPQFNVIFLSRDGWCFNIARMVWPTNAWFLTFSPDCSSLQVQYNLDTCNMPGYKKTQTLHDGGWPFWISRLAGLANWPYYALTDTDGS